MTKRDAFPVKAVTGSGHNTEGTYIFLEVEHMLGNKVAFALPPSVAAAVIDHAALQIDVCKRDGPPKPGYFNAYPTKAFAVGTDQNAGSIVLAMTFGLGGELSFQIPRDLARSLHEQIGKELEKPSPGGAA